MTSLNDCISAGRPDRQFTAADLALLPRSIVSRDVDYELDRGRLVEVRLPSYDHGVIAGRIGSALLVQGESPQHGRAFGKVGFATSLNPDSIIGLDAGFIRNSKLPVRKSPEGYLETIPDLVIEVRSKNDSLAEIERKVAIYLSAGVGIVWIVDPEARTITAHRPAETPQVYGESDTLAADDPIPNFRLNIAKLFR